MPTEVVKNFRIKLWNKNWTHIRKKPTDFINIYLLTLKNYCKVFIDKFTNLGEKTVSKCCPRNFCYSLFKKMAWKVFVINYSCFYFSDYSLIHEINPSKHFSTISVSSIIQIMQRVFVQNSTSESFKLHIWTTFVAHHLYFSQQTFSQFFFYF